MIRESGGDRSAVTGGTKVLSDRIVVEITSKPGETFIDRMIALVEGAQRQKTPNEIALNILLASLTIVFLLATVTLQPLAIYSGARQTVDRPGGAAGLPDPHHDRRPAVGDRHRRAWTGWCSATCWRCRAAPSKRPATSTPCCWTRPARSPWATGRPPSSCPPPASPWRQLADAAQITSLADETPEGRSIVVLAKERYGLRGRDLAGRRVHPVHRADPDERRRRGRTPTCARARPTPCARGSRSRAARSPRRSTRSWPGSRCRAARRSPWPRTIACWA